MVVAQGPYKTAPDDAALPDINVYPLLGPMGGGTTVMIQVRKTIAELCNMHVMFLDAVAFKKPSWYDM